jgi:hypothetical protein
MNLAYMSGWVALFLTMLATGFVEAPHVGATIAFLGKGGGREPSARRGKTSAAFSMSLRGETFG